MGAVLLGACALLDQPGTPSTSVGGEGIVTHPVDGDTVDVNLGGVDERVRLIGIDTPESVARDRPVECYGPEAKDRMAELLPPGTGVRLERDVEARDRYGRLLAYVIRLQDNVDINLLLVQEGYAEARRFEPNVARQAELDRAEAEAMAAGRGLWPACGSTDVPLAIQPDR
ncbi:MAG TPA: thermonuclease family protein [Acidimicrobiales bacterium]|nr:thermonuclease family protein [Acidimicrobiales bacterium]